MGLFEEQPLLLIPWILMVVVTYDAVKWAIKRSLRGRDGALAATRREAGR